MDESRVVFKGTGSHTGSALELSLAVIGVLIFLGLSCMAISDARLGSPFFYLPLALFCAAYAYRVIRRLTVTIALVRDDNGAYAIEVKGPAHEISMPFDFNYTFWYSYEEMKMRQGGYTMVRYNLLLTGRDGRNLRFRMEAGRAGGEPQEWQRRDEHLRDGKDVYQMKALIGFLRALQTAEERDER